MKTNILLDETTRKYFDPTTKTITQKFIDSQIKEMKELNPQNILDIGCGNGYITNRSREILGVPIIGCDIDEKRIRIGKKVFGGEFIIANINYLPFKSKSIDTTIASEVIEHVADIQRPLEEIKRISSRNVIITVPNDPIFMMANFLRGRHLKTFGNPHDHIHHFHKKSLFRTLVPYFSQIEVNSCRLFWLMAKIRI